tara:strand:+ start:3133 stop:3882 length:750 start_codon:yes stop_codon:yes gene_type:complete
MTSLLDPETEKQLAKDRTEAWLRDVYKEELGRDIDQTGLDYWTKDMNERGQNKNQVLSNIRRSDEKWLGDTYEAELGRELGDTGREYWAEDFKKGATRDEVKANIRRSNEYRKYQAGGKPAQAQTTQPIETEQPIEAEQPKYNYTPDPDRKYNKWWDSIDAAADTGNRMTDDYYSRFLPQMRDQVLQGVNEIGAADRYHGDRYEGKPPTYADPKELFDYYKSRTGDSDDDSTMNDLEKRIKELEDKYSI